MLELKNFIGGEFVPPASGDGFPSFEPATGQPFAEVPDSDERDVQQAVDSAQRAFTTWGTTSTEERARHLDRLADLIDKHIEELARAESADTGKPISAARSTDIPRASLNFRFFAEAIRHRPAEEFVQEGISVNRTVRDPIGAVGCISPWNLPLYLFTWKIAPALAAGNCVVGKPSEFAPVTAHLLCELCRDAGLPPGVLNVVHGRGAKVGGAIAAHPGIPAISFTGGTAAGRKIAEAAAPRFKRLTLEMGGKNPAIIFSDCDFEQALAASIRSGFSNQGQICLCTSRILVDRAIYARFRDELVQRVRNLKIGDPSDPSTEQGAVISREHMEKILGAVAAARSDGGRVLCGGERATVGGRCETGWFVQPTVVEGLPPGCPANQEEIFGPVVTLLPFASEQEALQVANATSYGLCATVWTGDPERAQRIAAGVQAGVVWVNCWMVRDLRTPFGGMKASGLGREGGEEALRFFSETKNVCLNLN